MGYDEAFKKFDTINPVITLPDVLNAHHLYVIRIDLEKLSCNRDEFYVALRKENIGVNVHYMPVHAHAFYQNNFDGKYPLESTCPNAMAVYNQMITLPCFPKMTDDDVKDVIAAVSKISNAYTKTGNVMPVTPGSLQEGEERPIKLITNFKNSDEYRAEIHQLIPGGAHTYSKGDDQFPLRSPAAIVKGEGAYVIDLDGNRYLDCSCGLTSVNLGHAYKPVINAVVERLHLGTNFQRPASIERDVAKEFLKQVAPIGHNPIKFAKNGSTVTG